MDSLSENYWNERYINNDSPWDLQEISPPLKMYFNQLTNKNISILIPGAGNSHEAEYLYNNGFKDVTVVDFAKAPLNNLKQRIPELTNEQLIQQDFFKHKGQYDLIVEQTFFCAINPSLRKQYALHMKQLLKPNGKLMGLLFDDELLNGNPPFGGSKKEYEILFSPLFNIKVMETAHNSIKPRAGRELFIILENQKP